MRGIRKVILGIFIIKIVEVIWQSWIEGQDRWMKDQGWWVQRAEAPGSQINHDLGLIQNCSSTIVWFLCESTYIKNTFSHCHHSPNNIFWKGLAKIGSQLWVCKTQILFLSYCSLIIMLFPIGTTVNPLCSILYKVRFHTYEVFIINKLKLKPRLWIHTPSYYLTLSS